jgi:DNA-binding CsgD family transcriptional regulator
MISPGAIASKLVPLFAPGLTAGAFRARASELLREVVGCHYVSFGQLNQQTRHLAVVFDPLPPGIEWGLPAFGKYMAQYPCFALDPTLNDGKPYLRSDYLSDEEFYNSPIYQEAFALGGVTDHAAMAMPQTGNEVFFIGLELCGGTFNAAHRSLMEVLQPHLANAYLLAQNLASLEQATADPAVFERAGLSQQQAQVLRWLAAGKTNPEISTIMALKPSTVKAYVQAVFDKLGVGNRHAALIRAHELARERTEQEPSPEIHGTYAPGLDD